MPAALQSLTLEPTADGGWIARWPEARWTPWIRVARATAAAPLAEQNGEEEALLVVLTGTHDLQAGGGSWRARGLRESVFEARPSAVFLPPAVRWQASGGNGEVLLAGAVQPAAPEAEPEPTQKKPLLALAGSGKAFDPGSMEWKPQESFPNAPEALLPRRIETRKLAGGGRCERVMPMDYKALTLTVDEFVLPEGAGANAGELFAADAGRDEALVFLRTEGRAIARTGDDAIEVAGDTVIACSSPTDLSLEAISGQLYAVVAAGGLKPQT